MNINTQCSTCQSVHKVDSEFIGSTAECSHCKNDFVVSDEGDYAFMKNASPEKVNKNNHKHYNKNTIGERIGETISASIGAVLLLICLSVPVVFVGLFFWPVLFIIPIMAFFFASSILQTATKKR